MLIFHSPVLILVTVQFWFWVVTSFLLCSCVVHVVLKTAILTYHSVMDAIIRQTVRKEMTRSASLVSERVASTEVATTWPTFSLRTVNRLSGLVNRIRNHGSNSSNKKTKNCQGTQNTGEVVSLWWKEERIYYCSKKRMVKHVSGVSKTTNTSRVYCILNLTILLAHFLPLIDVLFLFALVRFLGSPRTARRYNLRLNQLLSG